MSIAVVNDYDFKPAGQPDPGRFLAGSDIGFGGPPPEGLETGGVFFPPNLTPDEETGLGKWSEEEIVDAVCRGKRPDGRILFPMMPWPSYAALTDGDAKALAAYRKSIPAARHRVPENVDPGEKSKHPYLKLVPGD